jgi:hypothetical protein
MIAVRNMHSQVQYGTNLQYSVRGSRIDQVKQILYFRSIFEMLTSSSVPQSEEYNPSWMA